MDNYYDNNDFDINKFNLAFEDTQRNRLNKKKLEHEEYLKSFEKKEEIPQKITDMTIYEILSNTKNEFFDLLYELISFEYSNLDELIHLFTKNNRLFYCGLLLIMLSIILYIISYIFFYPSNKNINDINLNVPKDYSFKYYPYETQKSDQDNKIINLKNEINTLKKTIYKNNKILKDTISKTNTNNKILKNTISKNTLSKTTSPTISSGTSLIDEL